MGRIMAIDYGMKTAGIALSDETRTIAYPLTTIKREKEGKLRPTLRAVSELVLKYDVDLVLIGLPLHMDGSRGERAEKAEAFRDLVKKRLDAGGLSGVRLIMWDERLSTREADEVLKESGIGYTGRKQYVDKIAAALILEDYLRNGA